jgi:diguanylate cyclase (GGDEF)-like protein
MVQVERVCLAVLLLGIAANVAGWILPAIERMFPSAWQPMKAESVMAVLLSALCLVLSETRLSKWLHRLSVLLAVVVGLLAATALIKGKIDLLGGMEMALPNILGAPMPGRMSPESAAGFGLLSCSMVLTRAQGRYAVRIADLFTFCTCVTVLTLVSGHLFGTMKIFGNSTIVSTSPQTLLCLMLLTAVVLVRRAENGVFSIFTGRGIGGRLARILSPVLLVLPFLREGARARFIGGGQMPEHYVTAILASLAAMVSIALLLYLAWRINGMETEIHILTLRDQLTGLYNLRGFQLLAEQALRLAQRSKRPFSVLYIDLDNLKQTNDSLGHQAGSEFLVETSEILRATFRETDVLGRIGGDEFAVAGNFSRSAIETTTQRLETCCAEKNAEDGRRYALSFSVGHVTSTETGNETLDDLLVRADQAMYQDKRVKKDRESEGGTGPQREVPAPPLA